MNDDIDSIGGAMGAGAARDLSFVHMVVMKDSFERGMRMLAEMVEHPAFANEEIDRQRQQSLSFLKVSLEDPEFLANAVFDRLVYGLNPYGMPDSGTQATMASITRNDLTAFHDKFFVPNNAILAIVGDVTAEEAFGTVQKVFGEWKSREIVRDRLVEPPNSDASRRHRRQARLGPDRNPRRQHRHSPQSPGLHGAQPGDPHPRRRGQQPPPPGAADGAGADVRRAGRSDDAQRERRYRRGNQHPVRCHR